MTLLLLDGSREHITVIECICADGRAIAPTYVFKGTYFKLDWLNEDTIGARSCLTESGYSNSAVMLNWLIDTFEAETRAGVQDGEKRLLLLVSVQCASDNSWTLL